MDKQKLFLKLLTWVVMDGTIIHRSDFNKRIQFKLSKQRKIDRLIRLLEYLEFKYTFRKAVMGGINKLQPYYICLYANEAREVCDAIGKIKEFPKVWKSLSYKNLLVILEEIENTDGHRGSKANFSWCSTDPSNVEVITSLCKVYKIPINTQSKINMSGFNSVKLQYYTKINIKASEYTGDISNG